MKMKFLVFYRGELGKSGTYEIVELLVPEGVDWKTASGEVDIDPGYLVRWGDPHYGGMVPLDDVAALVTL